MSNTVTPVKVLKKQHAAQTTTVSCGEVVRLFLLENQTIHHVRWHLNKVPQCFTLNQYTQEEFDRSNKKITYRVFDFSSSVSGHFVLHFTLQKSFGAIAEQLKFKINVDA